MACQKNEHTTMICGGSEEFSCPPGMFCSLGERCGGLDKYGECQYIPDTCPAEAEEVCGCNDKTYTNACLANAATISVAYQGPCLAKNK